MVDVSNYPANQPTFHNMFESPGVMDRSQSIASEGPTGAPIIEEEEEEDSADYKVDGYHPVKLGDVFNGKYQVIRKLGWGHFSTVWLARILPHNADSKSGSEGADKSTGGTGTANSKKYVALKIMRSAPHYTEAAWDEVEALQRVRVADPSHVGSQYVVTIEDSFVHEGRNGKHVCMAFEVLGESLLSLLRKYNQNGIPQTLVKQIVKQVCLGLDYLHRVCGVIHTDLKPENVLIDVSNLDEVLEQQENHPQLSSDSVVIPSRPLGHDHWFDESLEIKVKIADLGNGCWVNKHFSNDIQTREYRAPEIILGAKWGASVDIWSLACMSFELITGDYLFEPQAGTQFSKNDDHVAQIIELLGRLPLSLLLQGQWTQLYFEQNGQLRNIFRLEDWSLLDVFVDKYGYSPEYATTLCDFMLPMLSLNPTLRVDAGGMSNHAWLADVKPESNIPRPAKGTGEDIIGWSSLSERLP